MITTHFSKRKSLSMRTQGRSPSLGLLLPISSSSGIKRSSATSIQPGKDGRPMVLIQERSTGNYEVWIKPILDRIAAALILILVSPIMGIVALLIRWDLRPGVIFKQPRIGKGGVPFTIYKFRTMHHERRKRQVSLEGSDRKKHITLIETQGIQISKIF